MASRRGLTTSNAFSGRPHVGLVRRLVSGEGLRPYCASAVIAFTDLAPTKRRSQGGGRPTMPIKVLVAIESPSDRETRADGYGSLVGVI